MKRHFLIEILLMLQFFSTAHAEPKDVHGEWPMFPVGCVIEMKDAWVPMVKRGNTWSIESRKNLNDLVELDERHCPEYLRHPNDASAIQKFVAQKQRILNHSPVIDRDGKALLKELNENYLDYQKIFARVEIEFPKTKCGKQMVAITRTMKARMQAIKSKISKLTADCFEANDKEAEKARAAETPKTNQKIVSGFKKRKSSISQEPEKKK